MDATAPVGQNVGNHQCPDGYHWDYAQRACVPDSSQQQQGGMSPAQAYGAYQQFAPASVGGGAGAGGAGAGTGGGATGAEAAGLMNPATALVAAIAGTAYGLDKNNVSTYKSQLTGGGLEDIWKSQNFQNHVPDWGVDAVKLQDPKRMLDPRKHAEDYWDAAKDSVSWFKDLFS